MGSCCEQDRLLISVCLNSALVSLKTYDTSVPIATRVVFHRLVTIQFPHCSPASPPLRFCRMSLRRCLQVASGFPSRQSCLLHTALSRKTVT
jgi:hypothetical protein